MPFKDIEKRRAYFRDYFKKRRAQKKQELRELQATTVYNFKRRMVAYVVAFSKTKEFKAFSKQAQESRIKDVLAMIDQEAGDLQMELQKIGEQLSAEREPDIIRKAEEALSKIGDKEDE